MPRGVARDHEAKRAALRRGAAAYFAAHGFDRASMTGCAQACGVSKALIYHYYDSKEALLADILSTHLTALVSAVEEAQDGPDDTRLRRLIRAILMQYEDADAEHKLQLEALDALPPEARTPLVALQRRLVDMLADALSEAAPLSADMRWPTTMTVFGMLNWFYMWHRPGKGITRQDYADLVTDMVLGGITAVAR